MLSWFKNKNLKVHNKKIDFFVQRTTFLVFVKKFDFFLKENIKQFKHVVIYCIAKEKKNAFRLPIWNASKIKNIIKEIKLMCKI